MPLRTPATLLGALAGTLLGALAAAQTPAPTAAAAPARPTAPPSTAMRLRAPSPEQMKEGKVLLAKFIQALGGAEKVGKVHDVWTRGMVTAKTDQGDMAMDVQTTMVFPDKISQQVDAPFGRMAMVATPSGAFIVGPNAVQDLPPAMKDELLRQVRRVPLLIAQKIDDPRLFVAAAGTERIGDVETLILDVSFEAAAVRWYLDPV
ncbi:MAG TPA: hypothetical protein VN032_02485, partial [Thermoanaerobaculia bacterium]|nr:hypothetical protein [Thermoanaerobaculia bacterium]